MDLIYTFYGKYFDNSVKVLKKRIRKIGEN